MQCQHQFAMHLFNFGHFAVFLTNLWTFLNSRSMVTRIWLCSSPDLQWWASTPSLNLISLILVVMWSISLTFFFFFLFFFFSKVCKITMESSFLAPQQISLVDTGALPTTLTQVKHRPLGWTCLKVNCWSSPDLISLLLRWSLKVWQEWLHLPSAPHKPACSTASPGPTPGPRPGPAPQQSAGFSASSLQLHRPALLRRGTRQCAQRCRLPVWPRHVCFSWGPWTSFGQAAQHGPGPGPEPGDTLRKSIPAADTAAAQWLCPTWLQFR